jgi:FtsP/CotA-like multicopper oxidase with cupredoxin domain
MVDFSTGERKSDVTQARAALVQKTLDRLSSGDLSAAERSDLIKRLQLTGFDTSTLTETDTQTTAANTLTTARLASTTLPAFQRLSVMTDEDGNSSDNNATYTFTPTADVNVTVNAYNDSTSQAVSWTTPMLRYNNQQLPPVIKAKRGQVMTLNLNNSLSEETTIHWHGFKIPGDQDGNPDRPVAASASMTYNFTMDQQASPLWFHPHPDMKTGSQVYKGLAGLFLLSDSITDGLEANNELPTGDNDIPVIIQDRQFAGAVTDTSRALVYDEANTMGTLGDTVLVNGVQLPQLDVPRHKVRLRLFNLSNARTYKFALSNGASFKQIGTDGGLLPAPIDVTSITLGAAERASIVIDFSSSDFSDGDKVMLVSQAFTRDHMDFASGMDSMGGMSSTGADTTRFFNGAVLDIMRFDVADNAQADPVAALYTALPSNADSNSDVNIRLTETGASTIELTMTLDRTLSRAAGSPIFVFNGQKFNINRIDQFIAKNAKQIVSIRNISPMPHPFHIHALQWQIIDRSGVAATGADLGWVDTILVQPGETVRIIGQFEEVNTGDYMFHCHILEHEDIGMMGFFRVLDEGEATPDSNVRDPNFVAP